MPVEQWYYRLDGRSHGPFNPIQFKKLIRGKTVTPATDVSQDGKTWLSLRDHLAGLPTGDSTGPAQPDLMSAVTLLPGQITLPLRSEATEKKTE